MSGRREQSSQRCMPPQSARLSPRYADRAQETVAGRSVGADPQVRRSSCSSNRTHPAEAPQAITAEIPLERAADEGALVGVAGRGLLPGTAGPTVWIAMLCPAFTLGTALLLCIDCRLTQPVTNGPKKTPRAVITAAKGAAIAIQPRWLFACCFRCGGT